MIGRIVITSVPRGLGGGDGVQTVLRTQGLSAPIADRLAQLASYPHPFDFGDSRNPRVLFHRIERAGGRTIHVLGSVRDAGSSYSGRSNHLAELIAFDSEEVHGLPGGPVFAALKFPWLDRWQGEPREVPPADEPAVPARDPGDPAGSGRPIHCEEWEKRTGDAGWAGELAKSFFDGRRAIVWVNQHDKDKVAALFAEAARLLPPSVRWQLEFNTCEIEPFPAHWRAIRQDLTVVGPRPSAQDLVLDLDDIRKQGLRCPDHPLARRARGEAAGKAAPAGAFASASGAAETVATPTATDPDDAALRERLKEIRQDRQRRSGTAEHRAASGVDTPWWNWRAAAAAGIGIPLVCVAVAAAVLINLDKNRALSILTSMGGIRSQSTPTPDGGLRTKSEDERLSRQKKEDERKQAIEREAREKAAKTAKEDRLAKEANEQHAAQEKKARETRERDEALAAQQAAMAQRQADKRTAIDHFKNNDAEKTVPIQQAARASEPLLSGDNRRPEEQDLCAFDAANLESPECEIWTCSPNTIRLWVERDDPADSWRVMGRQFDPLVTGWGSPALVVCRLAVRDRRLRMEWPERQITTKHDLFNALENSLLEISCRDERPDGKSEREARRILFTKPTDLDEKDEKGVEKWKGPVIDPLAGNVMLPLALPHPPADPHAHVELSRRLRHVDPGSLRWKFKLTLPNRDIFIAHPDRQATVKVPETPIQIGYEDVQKENKADRPVRLKKRTGQMQIATVVAFVIPQKKGEQAEFKISSTIDGLDDVPLLKNQLTLPFLKDQDEKDLSLMRDEVQQLLQQQANEDYQAIVFDLFLKEYLATDDGKQKVQECDGIKDHKEFRQKCSRLQARLFSVPKPGVYNVDRPGGGKETVTRTEADYEKDVKPLLDTQTRLEAVAEAARAFLSRRLRSQADAICSAIAGCASDQDIDAMKFSRDKFVKRIPLKILSISAVATARDSEGLDKGKTPVEIELIKQRSH